MLLDKHFGISHKVLGKISMRLKKIRWLYLAEGINIVTVLNDFRDVINVARDNMYQQV